MGGVKRCSAPRNANTAHRFALYSSVQFHAMYILCSTAISPGPQLGGAALHVSSSDVCFREASRSSAHVSAWLGCSRFIPRDIAVRSVWLGQRLAKVDYIEWLGQGLSSGSPLTPQSGNVGFLTWRRLLVNPKERSEALRVDPLLCHGLRYNLDT